MLSGFSKAGTEALAGDRGRDVYLQVSQVRESLCATDAGAALLITLVLMSFSGLLLALTEYDINDAIAAFAVSDICAHRGL